MWKVDGWTFNNKNNETDNDYDSNDDDVNDNDDNDNNKGDDEDNSLDHKRNGKKKQKKYGITPGLGSGEFSLRSTA